LRDRVDFPGRRPESELPEWYANSDIFVFPTIEDGFAVVLAQANANALPIITTTNCSGPDLVEDGKSGWVVPIRDPQAFVDRLMWCDAHRAQLAGMVHGIFDSHTSRTWDDVATDFESICANLTQRNPA
jgi:glycosyltransferase involved in cell wall biosynthesis